jgi:hypothetical protein
VTEGRAEGVTTGAVDAVVAVGAGTGVGRWVRPAEGREEGALAGCVTWLQAERASEIAEVQTTARALGGITAGSVAVALKTL